MKGAVKIILIVFVITAAALTGWYVICWKNKESKKQDAIEKIRLGREKVELLQKDSTR